jgi:hypothetical protein
MRAGFDLDPRCAGRDLGLNERRPFVGVDAER